jgi:ribosomal protein S18 acetylase RimI-like enzyme
MAIRDFDPARDLDAVLALWGSAGSGIHLGSSDEPAELRKKLLRDPDLFLVDEQDGRLRGAVMGGFDGRRGMVYHLAVAPEERRRGIGRKLMHELERRLKHKGCLKCYLLVAPDNPEALEFYQGLSWEPMDLHILGKELR